MDNNLEQIILVKDINPNAVEGYDADSEGSSNPNSLVQFQDLLYFSANDGETGDELWVSDGTNEGTKQVADINQNNDVDNNFANGSNARNFIEFQDRLYFTADDRINGDEVWVSDGTNEGTKLLADIRNQDGAELADRSSFADNFTVSGDRLYFTANDGENGNELWITDGTTEGTQLVKDVNPGETAGYFYPFESRPDSSRPNELTAVGDRLYFAADDGENGNELWVTDGTTEGTQLVKDINPGAEEVDYLYNRADKSRPVEKPIPFASDPYNLTEFDGKLYFSANNGENGTELWVSDGSETGTKQLIDLNPGSGEFGANSSSPGEFIQFGDRLYFAAETAESGRELWSTDGTSEGTKLVKDINPNSTSEDSSLVSTDSSPSSFIEFDGKLYFTADNGATGAELWTSNGTSEGTQLVKDINPTIFDNGYTTFPEGSSIDQLTESNGKLYFTANTPEAGQELWVSDGTTEGTQLVQDLRPGTESLGEDFSIPYSSYPDYLTTVGSELFFAADTEADGRELFKITAEDLEPEPLEPEPLEPEPLEPEPINSSSVNVSNSGNGVSVSSSSSSSSSTSSSSSSSAENIAGNAVLESGDSNDRLTGSSGNDRLDAGLGDDTLVGGAGNDTFVLDAGTGTDTIVDFELGSDRLSLGSDLQFENLTFADNNIVAGEEVLASLNGVDTAQLTADDFS